MLVIFTQALCLPVGLAVFWHRQEPQIQISSCHHTSDKIIQRIRTPWIPCLYGIWCYLFNTLERKKFCFELWMKYFELTSLSALPQINPQKVDIYKVFPILNKFVAHLFQSTDEYQIGDSLRFHLFFHKGKFFVNMPSGSDTLMLHSLRSANQGGYPPQSMHYLQMDGVILHFLRESTHIIHLLV